MTKRCIILIACSLLLASCNTKEQLRTTLMENPDILVEVMTRHKEKFAKVMGPGFQRPPQVDFKAQLDEAFKNPKKPEVDPKRVIRGKASAPITIVGYSDFQCPFCSRAEKNIEEVQKKYPNQVKYLFKHFPLDFHPLAMPASKAYEAIALQSKEKALKFQDEVFANQRNLGSEKEAFIVATAKKVGADVARMKKDMESEKVIQIVNKDIEEGKAMGVRGTPAFLVNGIFVSGARPASDFEMIIERLLKENRAVSSK